MEGLKKRMLYYAAGAMSGLSGIVSLPICRGNTCSSCLGCAGLGIGVLIVVIIKRFGGNRG